ncbi:mitochondrial fission process protein 1 isoform X1 [Parasteatoda tepidariorum]|uniref:mitochondrial fission process protein 1 isoform X1 n=1 Tax=Parasteatoda tepidariorum TaxID=114398 RepID=UPI00077F97E7|nr:mitochondrial fission process protein 1 isoform X1 [Parasteatoda tepidariorum]
MGDQTAEIDIYRDTPIRLLGYANEVGESFRALVKKSFVHASYVVAFGYVFADTADKVKKRNKILDENDPSRKVKLVTSAVDTLVWQTLASVAIPGFTINRLCATSMYLLKKNTKLPSSTRKWTTVAIGLGSIPFIVKPIDHLVDSIMNHTFRKWFM